MLIQRFLIRKLLVPIGRYVLNMTLHYYIF
jgi:hypothetical protein